MLLQLYFSVEPHCNCSLSELDSNREILNTLSGSWAEDSSSLSVRYRQCVNGEWTTQVSCPTTILPTTTTSPSPPPSTSPPTTTTSPSLPTSPSPSSTTTSPSPPPSTSPPSPTTSPSLPPSTSPPTTITPTQPQCPEKSSSYFSYSFIF